MKAIDLIREFFGTKDLVVDLRRVVGAFLRHRPWAEADDLIQQAVLDMVEKPDDVRATNAGELRERIRRNTQRRHIDDIRRRRREFPLAGIPEPEARRQNQEEQEDRLTILRDRIERLSDDHKELVRLRYCEDLSTDAIATRRGQSPAAVERALGRIRRRLGAELSEMAQFRPLSGN